MEGKAVGFYVIVAVLGILSAALGFAAEATKVKASDIDIVNDLCVYPSSPALGLGIAAAVIAIIGRVYICITVGGCGCCRNDPNSTPISKLFSVLSWVASVIAVALLLVAAGLNNREGGQVNTYGYIMCYVVKPGIFAAGAILALLSAIFEIASYATLTLAAQTVTGHAANNVELGKNSVPQYQYPPQQYPPHQYPPQQPPQQYPPQQYPPQEYPPQPYI